jgi:hypothetical protein
MTYDDIIKNLSEQLLKYYVTWRTDISMLYGERYADKYCTYYRFREHIEIMGELAKEETDGTTTRTDVDV